jgi:DNA-binding transcriptional LysR family regulator
MIHPPRKVKQERNPLFTTVSGWNSNKKLFILVPIKGFVVYSDAVEFLVMSAKPCSLSTDHVAAFVELARQGSLRAAAGALHLTEQGVRNPLLALESRLRASLYHKQRGPRRSSPLTDQGRHFLPHALAFLERAVGLAELFASVPAQREVHVAATQYLILYTLIDAVARFRKAFPDVQVRLSNRTEREIEAGLLNEPDVDFGVAAPYETAPGLDYRHLFSLDWGLVAPPRHPLLRRPALKLRDLVDLPLIFFERGSTGRQHVLDAFHALGLSPRIVMETTNTEIVVRMVEAGLGLALAPLLHNGEVTRGRPVGVRMLRGQVRPIQSGVLLRRGAGLSPAAEAFLGFLLPPPDRSTPTGT